MQWEYLIVDLKLQADRWSVFAVNGSVQELLTENGVIDDLTQFGTEGWELVTSTRSSDNTEVLYFKRPKVDIS